MAYVSRYARKRATRSPESMYLLVVIAAGVATAVWAARGLGPDLSAIQTAAAVLGITETVGATRHVGYSVAHAQTNGAEAPFCNAGQQPTFSGGMAALKQQVGNVMGTPVECEHAASVVGDTVQQTSTGLAAYEKLTNTVTFTDGWRHWALTANGLVQWDGTQAEPPAG